MQIRVDAMLDAVAAVQPPFQKFYDLLNDEQKAWLNGPPLGPRASASAAKLKEMQDAACQASREPQDQQQTEKPYRQFVAQQWLDDINARRSRWRRTPRWERWTP